MQHDIIRLQHMLDAGKDALQFALGRERTHLENDRMLTLALIKALEIIGEAASKVSENFKQVEYRADQEPHSLGISSHATTLKSRIGRGSAISR